jgi:hypothetical protein
MQTTMFKTVSIVVYYFIQINRYMFRSYDHLRIQNVDNGSLDKFVASLLLRRTESRLLNLEARSIQS